MLTVGEIWDVSDLVAPYVGDQLDLAFEFSLAKAILLAANEGRATPLDSAVKELHRLYPEGGYATFLTNHDQNRVMDQLGRDPAKAKLAATILFTLPGTPFVYYGEEIGMTGSKPDELIRTPMQWSLEAQAGFTTGTPWQLVNDGYEETNVEVQAGDPDSLLSHYRALIALRNEHPALSVGKLVPVQSADSKVYAFLRLAPEEQVLVVLNLQDTPATDYALSQRKGPLASGTYQVVDLLTGEEAAPLVVDSEGTFKDYLPLPELGGQSAPILQFVAGGE
jgi:glycosidase